MSKSLKAANPVTVNMAAVTMPTAETRAESALWSALDFGERLGYETYDPFDIKSLPVVARSYHKPNLLNLLARKGLFAIELLAPLRLRQFLKTPKRASAGGVARWSQACLAAHSLDSSAGWLEKSESALRWLVDHPGDSPVGLGWGVPFPWTTYFGDVPANAAVSHTTHNCGSALMDFHDATGQAWPFEAAQRCCQFLTEGLNKTDRETGSTALSYTPLDNSQVVNISAETAAFLLRCGRPADQPMVWRLAKFVVEQQGEDGAWRYSATDSVDGENPIDHYHTAMVLHGLTSLTAEPECRQALEKGLAFHLKNHFETNGCPKMRPTSTYPVDSFSAGESMLLLTKVLQSRIVSDELLGKVSSTLERLLEYSLAELMFPDGGFAYRRYPRATMRIDSLRWAQALMCHGLAEACLLERTRITKSERPARASDQLP
ncbi:MAG: hypothetical protein JSS66_12315 [Armatimonadetes bacterium]|nr:hypothetical protein [Armatimonadota bacterium]